MLKLDYSFMLSEVVGTRCGISEDELAGAEARANQIHQQLQASRKNGELPFYELPFQQDLQELLDLADNLASRFENIVVLGIGGSALGTRAIAKALLPLHYNMLDGKQRGARPRLFVLDNVDPAGINATLDLLNPASTCFCVPLSVGISISSPSAACAMLTIISR